MSNVSEAEVRAEVREWLAANWDPDMSLVEWRSKLADSGWGMPQWPKEWYGRGLPHALARVVEEEFANVGAVRAASSGVRLLAAATLLEHGSDQQKKRSYAVFSPAKIPGASSSASRAAVPISPALPHAPI
jgi:alkylation response protein AidB-like acyl-CoA dehydrogenase